MINIFSKNTRFLIEAIFWILLWIITHFLVFDRALELNRVFYRILILTIGQIAIVFATIYVLFPRFYESRRYLIYVLLSIVVIVLLAYCIDWAIDLFVGKPEHFRRGPGGPNRSPGMQWRRYGWYGLGRMMPLFFVWVVSSLIETTLLANQKERESTVLRSEKLEAEMKFLKSQINPHFLFNALNNIYTLTLLKSDEAPENLLKLSNMLRYVLYDCNEDLVPLKKDVAYLRDYIDLKMLKDSSGLAIEQDIDDISSDAMVAPMLFIPFVENAFKHSKIEDIGKGWIRLKLKEEKGRVFFEVSNSLLEDDFSKDKVGGIGTDNVRRRLELLYPGKHQIDISSKELSFSVQLTIDLT